MRSLTTTLIWIISLNIIYAQVPLGFSFQTIIRDGEGKVQKNQTTGIQFTILEGNADGTAVYTETHTVSTNEYGVINLSVGTGIVTEGVFSDIVWGSNIHFLKTEIDPTGGSTYTISTTSQLMSVPYAMYAMKADTAINTNIPNTANNGDILYYRDGNWNQLATGNQGDFLRVNEIGEPVWQSFAGYVSDIDGNSYPLIKIGNQIWFQENLKTSKYNDGTLISEVTDNTEWSNLSAGAWCNYNNNISNDSIFGKLYNWYAVETSKVCPIGWHVPEDNEWSILIDFLGGESMAGGKLKIKGNNFWSYNTDVTNETGFSAFPGGSGDFDGSYNYIFGLGFWWSATPNCCNDAFGIDIGRDKNLIYKGNYSNRAGHSIRCIKD